MDIFDQHPHNSFALNSQNGRTGSESSGKQVHHDFFSETAKKSGEIKSSLGLTAGSKTITHLLDSPAAQAVLEMGIPNNIIQLVTTAYQLENGSELKSAQELYKISSDIKDSPEKMQELISKISLIKQKIDYDKQKIEHEKTQPSFPKISEQHLEMSLNCSENSGKVLATAQLKQHVRALAVENKKLKERKKCRSCKTVELTSSGVTFLPCGHFITCEACAEKHENCPACNQTIMGTVRTFLA